VKTVQQREEEPKEVGAGDYFVVAGPDFSTFVSTAMARHIEACLDRTFGPRWITFVDISGSRIRLRARQIQSISQCTADQRQRDRELTRALKKERRADCWPDDE
jgi:hypothetical protein